MAADPFKTAVAAINRCFENEDFEEALPHCAKAAELQPETGVGLRCRVYALLQLSRWSDALQACEKAGKGFDFEKAYCLYRLNRFKEALAALPAAGGDGADKRDRLEAQVRYRMGDYENCAKSYQKLFQEDGEEVGLLVNAAAANVSGERAREALSVLAKEKDLLEDSYELNYNLACAYIDENRLAEAEEKLRKAEDICIAELMEAEGIAEEEKDSLADHAELAAIHVQRGCVLQRRGAQDEANDLYSRVLKQKAGQDAEVDVTVLAVACNNVVALRSEGKSLFDSLKRINVASKESLEHKLTRRQTIEIAVNKCLLLVQAHKYEEAKRELQRLRESHPGHPRVAIVSATIAQAEKKPKVCEEVLQTYLAENPSSEEVLLALAQLYAQSNRMEKAVEALAKLPVKQRVQPRSLEAIASLHLRQKSPDKAKNCLQEGLDFWTSKEAPDDEQTLAAVLRIVTRIGKQLKADELVAQAYQVYLEKVDGGDNEALCGIVQALASTDVERAEQYAQRLKVPAYSHLDAEELENVAIPKISFQKRRSDQPDAEGEGAGEAEKVKKKRIRKRKIRYPKGFDPANPGPPPDPERWLPKRERTEFKKKMRKREKNLLRGPQGAMVTDDNAFRKQGPSTAQVEVSKDGTTGSRRNQGRKQQGRKK
eukprot:TRINITY_DN7123_c0_g2_i1.p1 TRINITY_DN7123_c0_g2~~TRINITY_DN7123_c0_g2_i1.p1  ORF type:complete len:682 (+),score=169.56 TRINITY_DN7123_c0_g2_i1:83-2047(+)